MLRNKKYLLPRDKISEIISALDFKEIVRAAYNAWKYGLKTGFALIDLSTGNLFSKSIEANQVHEDAKEGTITLYRIQANDNLLDENRLLPINEMYHWRLITEEEYEVATEQKNPDFIKELRQRYYAKNDTTLEELALQEIREFGEMDWFYIHHQLREIYKE